MKDIRPEFTTLSVVIILLISLGLFLCVILFLSRNRNIRANKYLALLILFFSIAEIWEVLYLTRYIVYYPHMLLVLNPVIYVFGPLILFYVKSLTDVNWKFRLKSLVHFIPAAAWYIYFTPLYLLSRKEKMDYIQEALRGYHYFIPKFFFIILLVQTLAYLIYALKLIMRHGKRIRNNFSYSEHISLKWLRNFLIFFIIIWLSFAVRVFYPSILMWYIYSYISLTCLYVIGYFGYNQPVIFDKNISAETAIGAASSSSEVQPAAKKYSTSKLNNEEKEEYLNKLWFLMATDKLYLKNNLKLGDVALKMNLPVYYVSQVINEQLGKNFYDFVNEYRVEEAKKILADKKYNNKTVLAAGFESGFNSKSVFYTSFKEMTGLTPTAYKKKFLIK